ncbi:ATP-binding protein [Sporichthya polymorpha]|uniref:ATP-binding protein n=1 Tax=Sporichthya polymorpha TaxID=35751 RepID=UPI00036AC278|nr:ATP-binding protein [Sporichthya polymorpha]
MAAVDAVRVALDSVWGGALARSIEDVRLDLKEDAATVKESGRVALDAALCLANTAGGSIVFGVQDAVRGREAFVGTSLDPTALRKYIYDNSRPRLLVDVEEIDYRGHRLVVISVRTDDEIYADTKGRAPYRIGSDCVGMDPATAQRVRDERRGFDRSAGPANNSAVDNGALARARQRLQASLSPVSNGLAKLSDEDLLRALGLTDGDGRLLLAGEYLLGAGTTVHYLYRDSPGGEPRMVERFQEPLIVAFDHIMRLFELRRQFTPVTLPDGQQLQVEDFPELAIREALINALMHRDLASPAPVVVEHSPSVLVITSPGPLVAGVTVDNILTHPSTPRNRSLTSAVRLLELAEEIGRGVDRMYREMIRSGRPAPTIDAGLDSVRVALVGGAPDVNVARYVGTLPASIRDDTDAMLILLRLCGTKTVHAPTLASLLQKSAAEAEAALRRLASEPFAIVEPTRQSMRAAHPHYRLREEPLRQLGSAITYARRTMDEIDRRVIAHVREYGRITNATVQNLFNVSMPRARQILAGQVDRELLVKTSQAQRGPGVEYGPGRTFPPAPDRRRRGKTATEQELPLDL